MASGPSFRQDDAMMSEINVTPLVDVMLVLLVVFIITAPLLTPQVLKVSLPRTQSVSTHDPLQPMRLVIDAQGRLAVDGAPVSDQALAATLRERATDRHFVLQIEADQAVRYGRVAEIMALAQHAEVVKISLVTIAAKTE